MAHTYISSHFHAIFSTKNRQRLLTPELRKSLSPYLGGIARRYDFKVIESGGVDDHLHTLISLPATMDVARAMQLLKGGSSKWIRATHKDFSWQTGYAAFATSTSLLDKTLDYIRKQEQHHKKLDFKTEYIRFLKANNIEYDPRYVFD